MNKTDFNKSEIHSTSKQEGISLILLFLVEMYKKETYHSITDIRIHELFFIFL